MKTYKKVKDYVFIQRQGFTLTAVKHLNATKNHKSEATISSSVKQATRVVVKYSKHNTVHNSIFMCFLGRNFVSTVL